MTCKSDISNCGNSDILPVSDPKFNFREAAKNMLLLEDHLFNKGKVCRDCCTKHSLLIEGFLEEAISLDINKIYYSLINESLTNWTQFKSYLYPVLEKNPINTNDCVILAHKLRSIRKPLCEQFGRFIK
jgi:hypothetical protein